MRFVKDEGLILRVKAFSETSKLITLFTRNYGKVIVLAKGANRKKNIFLGQLDLFFYGEFVWQTSIKNDFNTLIENDVWSCFSEIRRDVVIFGYANYVLELVSSVVQFEDINETLFLDTVCVLNFIALSDLKKIETYVLFFEIKLLLSLGLFPDFLTCSDCGNYSEELLILDKRQCLLVCSSCIGDHSVRLPITKDVQKIITTVVHKDFKSLYLLKLSNNQLKSLREILNIFLDFGLEKQLKSLVFLNKLFRIKELSR